MKNRTLSIGFAILLLILASLACEFEASYDDVIKTEDADLETDSAKTEAGSEQELLMEGGTSLPSSPTPAATPEGVAEQFFSVWSIGSTYNTATVPTVFTTTHPWFVIEILTYHWNDGNGKTPGTIGLQASDGSLYGPWQAIAREGSGVSNAAWVVNPYLTLPPGTYTVLDSDPITWSQNEETAGAGMAWGIGIRVNNP